jgi:hypothetical protein
MEPKGSPPFSQVKLMIHVVSQLSPIQNADPILLRLIRILTVQLLPGVAFCLFNFPDKSFLPLSQLLMRATYPVHFFLRYR